MLRQAFLLLFCCLLILSACNSEDQNSRDESANLPFVADNLVGDWKRIAQFKGQPNDSLGILEPKEDLFIQFENCRKDDIIRYVKGTQQEQNSYFWGIGKIPCHSQIADSFIEIGTWSLPETGKLSHSYSDVIELFIVVKLQSQQLLVRKESGMEDADGVIYEFTQYDRIKYTNSEF